ncbi:hypothetical protein KCP77_20455 [Salmonella enterica subsp. enterica]|nr:hypothetical protein KCP77_20455 [Salmonella enterica subsp. enterica]
MTVNTFGPPDQRRTVGEIVVKSALTAGDATCVMSPASRAGRRYLYAAQFTEWRSGASV